MFSGLHKEAYFLNREHSLTDSAKKCFASAVKGQKDDKQFVHFVIGPNQRPHFWKNVMIFVKNMKFFEEGNFVSVLRV